jgi:hypothetical protein
MSIARDFIATNGASGTGRPKAQPQEARRGFTAKLFGPDLWKLARQHLLLVAVSVGIAIFIGVPIAILVFSHVRLRAVVLGLASLMQTVPSLALLAVLISMLGAIGALPALIALTLVFAVADHAKHGDGFDRGAQRVAPGRHRARHDAAAESSPGIVAAGAAHVAGRACERPRPSPLAPRPSRPSSARAASANASSRDWRSTIAIKPAYTPSSPS